MKRADVIDLRASATAQQTKCRSFSQSSLYIGVAGLRWRADTLRRTHSDARMVLAAACIVSVSSSALPLTFIYLVLWFLFSLSIRVWGNDQHRLPSASASADTCSSSSFCSSFARSPCVLSVVGALPRMRAPLLGQAAMFAALMVLSNCLTGKSRCYLLSFTHWLVLESCEGRLGLLCVNPLTLAFSETDKVMLWGPCRNFQWSSVKCLVNHRLW